MGLVHMRHVAADLFLNVVRLCKETTGSYHHPEGKNRSTGFQS